jgi:hypothetical protein
MNLWKCKCGKKEYLESGMPPRDCEGCEKCKTNYKKEPLQPHDFTKVMYNENTGKPYKMCSKCYLIDKESYEESKSNNITNN